MIIINLENITKKNAYCPKKIEFINWVNKIPLQKKKKKIITIRIVDSKEIKKLNFIYRNIKKTTNILSFPYNLYLNSNEILLGDLVICSKIIKKEAKKQKKNIKGHWAHIFIHGVLHLLGFDHIKKREAKKMELLECRILKKLGFKNPYIR